MKNTKLYAVGMAIIALLGIISRLLDKQLAKLLFKSGNFIVCALRFLLCNADVLPSHKNHSNEK